MLPSIKHVEGKKVITEAQVFQCVSFGLCSASTPLPETLPVGGELDKQKKTPKNHC